MKRITNTMLFNKFKRDVLPQITGDKWCNARVCTKMDLFEKYVRHLVQADMLTKEQAAEAEIKFVQKFIKEIL